MRIAITGFRFHAVGGLEGVSRSIAAALAADHEVDCLALHESASDSDAVSNVRDGFRVVPFAPRNAVLRSLYHRLPTAFRRGRLAKQLAVANLVIAAHAHTLPLVMPLLASLPSPPPVICWLHGLEVWGQMGLSTAPWLRQADRLVAVSHYTAGTVAPLLDGGKLPDVIANPVETDLFQPVSDPSLIRRNTILSVGRHDDDCRGKGYDVLIDALGLLRGSRPDLDLRLTITGTGPLLEDHRRRIAERGVADRVTLTGRVTRDELIRLYATTDIFAFPSRLMDHAGCTLGEGFGLVNAEAAASGRPVLTSTHGGCPETVIDGVTGFAVDPTSASAVASAIARLFDMPQEERDAMGARGRANAIERFSQERFAAAVRRLAAETSDSPRPRHPELVAS
jgi:glycosyltransferase involved in cell wall biosynthesis